MAKRLSFFVLLTAWLSVSAPAADPIYIERAVPKAGVNNVWFRQNPDNKHTVVIFIHGIFSDSRGAWLYEDKEDPKKNAYWPEMVFSEYPFQPSIYLAGFSTDLTSGNYDMPQAAGEIAAYLNRDGVTRKYKNVILVGHSTGGILARYLLVHHQDLFADKKIGLVLMASPSLGSDYAKILSLPAKFMNQKMGQQLQTNNDFLKQLDSDFFELLRKRTYDLTGLEVIENKMVVVGGWLPMTAPVVSEVSGSRYFAPAQMIGGTDHFSVIKPTSRSHPAHVLLKNFYYDRFYYNRRSPGDLANAIKAAELGIEKSPKNPTHWYELAKAHSEKGTEELAIRFYGEALDLFPNDLSSLHGRAYSYMNKRKYDLAIVDLTKLMDLDSDDKRAPVLRGVCWQKKGLDEKNPERKREFHESAVEDFQVALKLHKTQETLWYLSTSLSQLDRKEESKSVWDEGLDTPRENPTDQVWREPLTDK